MKTLEHFRFDLATKALLYMTAHNKGNMMRGGFGGAEKDRGDPSPP